MVGITSYGGYIPRLRLDRSSIYQSMGWLAPATMMVAQGSRSVCNWDEDSLTMAVAASRDCLIGSDRGRIGACYLGSVTLPFLDRQAAGVLAAALNLRNDVRTADFGSSLKAGTTALVSALDTVASGAARSALVAAADRREAKAGSFYEMWFGDGAAALLVGKDDVIAELKGTYSVTYDFVDHYRGAGERFDYTWEERWARDAGYSKVIPEVVKGLLDSVGLKAADVHRLVFPCFFTAEHRSIAKALGFAPDRVVPNMHDECGETGAAHPLVMLVRALEQAKPGERILVASFGQGSDALLFETTDAIARLEPRSGIAGSLERRKALASYPKFLKFRGLIETETGVRAETPTRTSLTTLWRQRKMLLGLVGGRCTACGTPQFPKAEICVNPSCGAVRTQEDYEFAGRTARVRSFTGDMLAVSVDPPSIYGMIQFEGGGRFMADFTDCEMGDVRVGQKLTLSFRRRYTDPERGFTGYFWKAVPTPTDEVEETIRFDGRVAIVTGAGGGLGRAYALELARRGAKVVVNDYGGGTDGSGGGASEAADRVVREIEEAGGEAVASYESVATVEGGERIVAAAVERWGRVDILVNNAGILRDKSFVKLVPEAWDAVMDVHLRGAYNVTRPAFARMRDAGYGRVVLTTSAAGLYGNFGQANYSAAKLGLVGLMNTLKLEGEKAGVLVNTVAPLAASRLTAGVFPADLAERLKPELVAPLVVFLCSQECTQSGLVINAGGGCFSRAAILTGPGKVLGSVDEPAAPEAIAESWGAIGSLEGAREHAGAMPFVGEMLASLTSKGGESGGGAPAAAGSAVSRVFERMGSAFRADKAASVSVVFQFNITGPSGGEWNVTVKDEKCAVSRGAAPSPTVTVTMADEDFVRLMSGELDPMGAFTTGRLKLSGDMMKAQLITKLFSFGKA